MQIAVITGASSGMGKEFVQRILLDKKISCEEIWLIARRKERLKEWETLYPNQKFRLFSLDLSKTDSFPVIKKALEESCAEIVAFVHSAGFGVMGKIMELSMKDQFEMLDLNCKSTVALTEMLLPYMKSGGRMIYMASAAAFLPQPGFAVYAASKAFVLSFVRSLRREEKGRKLKITAVCPGAVKTEFFDRALGETTLPVYKKLVMANSKKVVKKAWRDNGKNAEISVYGTAMKLFMLLAKLLPHSVILRFVKG